MDRFERAFVVVLDGVGCGTASDTAAKFARDVGTNSLVNASLVKPIDAQALQEMGLEHIPGLEGLRVVNQLTRDCVIGAFGSLDPTSIAGNGSPEGHWALMGHEVQVAYDVFNETGIPEDLVFMVEEAAQEAFHESGKSIDAKVIRYPGKDDVNGEVFIQHPAIGPVHLQSLQNGNPLFVPTYTSTDSLVQIALCDKVMTIEMMKKIASKVREKLNASPRRVARVILRPFTVLDDGSFKRISSTRKDYGVDPDNRTLIDELTKAQKRVTGIGKAASMFNGRGFPRGSSFEFKTDEEKIRALLNQVLLERSFGLTLLNIVGTDELYGHPRRPAEYITLIELIDSVIAEIKRVMQKGDLLIVTSDHGNDPTQGQHNNHTRERVPFLAFSPIMDRPIDLGKRDSYTDVAATLAENFSVVVSRGKSFLGELLGKK